MLLEKYDGVHIHTGQTGFLTFACHREYYDQGRTDVAKGCLTLLFPIIVMLKVRWNWKSESVLRFNVFYACRYLKI